MSNWSGSVVRGNSEAVSGNLRIRKASANQSLPEGADSTHTPIVPGMTVHPRHGKGLTCHRASRMTACRIRGRVMVRGDSRGHGRPGVRSTREQLPERGGRDGVA